MSTITQLEGDYKVDKIHFRKATPGSRTQSEKLHNMQNYFIKPDVIIAEGGVGRPKVNLKDLIGEEEPGQLNSLTFNN